MNNVKHKLPKSTNNLDVQVSKIQKKKFKNAGLFDTQIGEIIIEVVLQCENCKRFKKPTPQPVVGLPKATEFNQTISVDLHYLEPNTWCLHMIDKFSRFSNAVII